MAHEIIALMAQYGVLLVFLNVLVTQLGAPLPAVPTLVVAGSLAAAGGPLALAGTMAAVVAGCLLGDSFWYVAGRRYGAGVMRLLCRMSLSPDSCVQRSELRFQRWRGQVLLVAKFVPGLSTVGSSLVGAPQCMIQPQTCVRHVLARERGKSRVQPELLERHAQVAAELPQVAV